MKDFNLNEEQIATLFDVVDTSLSNNSIRNNLDTEDYLEIALQGFCLPYPLYKAIIEFAKRHKK